MKRIYFILALTICMISSCSDRPVTADNSLRVGNIMLSDNSIISPVDYDSNSNAAVGVIFYVNGDTVLVVSKDNLGSRNFSDSLVAISGVNGDFSTLCGVENTVAIAMSGVHSPAYESIASYNSPIKGWSLPSAGELRILSRNLPIVEQSMSVIEGNLFESGQYFSSTEDGIEETNRQKNYFAVSFPRGFVISVDKRSASLVRPVLRLH